MTALISALSKLTGRAPVADVERAHAEAQAAVVAAEAELAAAEAAYRSSLLDADAKVSRAARERRFDAEVELDRARAAVDALEAKLGEARERAAESERRRKYNAARKASEAAQAALRERYEPAARAIVELFHEVAAANQLVAEANEALPAGAEPLLPAEQLVRGLPALPREVVSEEPLERWHFTGEHADRGEVPSELVPRIQRTFGLRRGKLDIPIHGRLVEAEVRLEARRKRVTFLPERSAFRPEALHATVRLPGLLPGQEDIWTPCGHSSVWAGSLGTDAAEVLAAVAESRAAQGRPGADPRARDPEFLVVPSVPTPEDDEPGQAPADDAEAA